LPTPRRCCRATLLLLAAVVALAACRGEREQPAKPTETARLSTEQPGISEADSEASAVDSERWNVVLITLDAVRADALGAYGQDRGATPNLDRLAAEGVVFDAALSSSPSTLPSHASILTGKYPYAHGARSNIGSLLPQDEVTLAERLKDAGYRTAAEIAAMVLRTETRIAQGFDEARDPKSPGVVLKSERRDVDGETVQIPIRVAADISRSGREFIRMNRDRPFFLWLHFFDAHEPINPPLEFASRYPDDLYLAEVAYVDAEIGKLIASIADLQLRPRTLVVVIADHGEGRGEHGELRHSFFVYDSTMRVPLILWGPDALPSGKRIDSVVRSVDVAPTLLDLLGQPPLDGVQGTSLRPLLSGGEADLALTAYGESLELHNVFGVQPLRFVRNGRWKYIHKVNPELYDIEDDPHERNNLSSREAPRVEEMQARLRSLLSGAARSPDARIAIDEEARANLEALGYAAAMPGPEIDDEIASLELVGDDPATKVEAVKELSVAGGFLKTGQFDRAYAGLNRLLEDDPDSTHLLALTGVALVRLGRFGEALPRLEKAVKQDPENRDFRQLLIVALEHEGRPDEAAREMRRLLEIDPCLDLREKLYLQAQQRGDHAEEFRVFEEGAKRCPESANNLINYAWVLATVPIDELRDGKLALATINRGFALLDGKPGPAQLDTLAAVHAENGDFEEAMRTEREALRMLEAGGAAEPVLAVFRGHLGEFEAGRAIRDE
jgi:arylsulfatase A-like enzyme